MTEVVSVRFKNKGKVYYFDPAGIAVPTGAQVIVETSKGLEMADSACGNHLVEDSAIVPPLRPVVRVATAEDLKKAAGNKAKEKEAFELCQKKIAQHKLDMKLVDVEFSFEGSKILFFFTSDGRVDFRELVKDLASAFKTRIELRQIGVRDEARMLGGLGICGKQFCCSQFLEEFHPVSIKMAKTQGLSLNPVKISGTCGRLMCCLKYEERAYEDLVKRAPKVDAFVDTPAGKGSVTNVNLLRGHAKVRLEDGADTTLKTFSFDELDVLGGKARRAEYIAARAEGRLEEAGFTERPRRLAPTPPPAAKSPDGGAKGAPPAGEGRPRKKPASQQKSDNRRPRGRGKPGGQAAQAQGPGAPAKAEKAPPAQKQAAPAAGTAPPKKSGRRPHRGGRGRKPGGPAGQAQGPGAPAKPE